MLNKKRIKSEYFIYMLCFQSMLWLPATDGAEAGLLMKLKAVICACEVVDASCSFPHTDGWAVQQDLWVPEGGMGEFLCESKSCL